MDPIIAKLTQKEKSALNDLIGVRRAGFTKGLAIRKKDYPLYNKLERSQYVAYLKYATGTIVVFTDKGEAAFLEQKT